MQSTGHSSMHALSSRSTHGSAITYVTGGPSSNPRRTNRRAAHCTCSGAGTSKPNISAPRRDTTVAMKIGVVVLKSSDLGHRVVVRHLTDRGPTDVLGELITFDADRLVVRTERGEERVIARTAVIAGKP